VLDSGVIVAIERAYLCEIPSDLSGLLEPVSDPNARFKLFGIIPAFTPYAITLLVNG